MAKKFSVWIGMPILLACFANNAAATSIETLVMPGPVIQDHAEFEENCSLCHTAFSKSLQRDRCLDCHDHQEIAEDINTREGFHGRFSPARNSECSSCHTEHEGRDADIIRLDDETFDHQFTDFPLKGSHEPAACDGCHKPNEKHRIAVSDCFGCHENDDNHDGNLDENCSSCHQETNWQDTNFDHSQETDFALTGAHKENECNLCHINQKYESTPTDCYSCHRIDDIHNGGNGTDCETCHGTKSWDDSAFDHARETDFALEGKHTEISCESCHVTSKFDDPLEQSCISCHRSDDDHQGLNGEECSSCHKPDKWAKNFFDHDKETEFLLVGHHKDQSCQACHKGPVFEVPLEVGCVNCHRNDDVHQGNQGTGCGVCHQESGWNDNVSFDHDFTAFPLIGLHAVAPCEACHLSAGFQETGNQCVDCHAGEDPHKGGLGTECNSCHNPNDWQLWEFDHNASTDFILDGAHTDLTCRSCHEGSGDFRAAVSTACAGCHRRDDVHSGQFGSDCSRCHTTSSFIDPGKVQ